MPQAVHCLPDCAPSLDISGLESIYETLASTIDSVGHDKTELFLVKLALLCAQRIGDAQTMLNLVASARKDL